MSVFCEASAFHTIINNEKKKKKMDGIYWLPPTE